MITTVVKRRDIEGTQKGPSPETVRKVRAAFRLRKRGWKWREIAVELGFRSAGQAHTFCYKYDELVP